MAKTFVQLIALIAIMGAIIGILGMETKEPMVGMFKLAVPLIGAIMLGIALKSDFPAGIYRNKEIAITGFATIILGVTHWFGDIPTPVGITLGSLGWMIAIGAWLFLIITTLFLWEWKK